MDFHKCLIHICSYIDLHLIGKHSNIYKSMVIILLVGNVQNKKRNYHWLKKMWKSFRYVKVYISSERYENLKRSNLTWVKLILMDFYTCLMHF